MNSPKEKISPAIVGVLAGAMSIPASSACGANCTACFRCVAAGGVILLLALLRNRLNMSERSKTRHDAEPFLSGKTRRSNM